MATLLISLILVLVVFAAYQPAPATGKYGAVAGISLLVFSVFQLVTFALMASFIKKSERRSINMLLDPPELCARGCFLCCRAFEWAASVCGYLYTSL